MSCSGSVLKYLKNSHKNSCRLYSPRPRVANQQNSLLVVHKLGRQCHFDTNAVSHSKSNCLVYFQWQTVSMGPHTPEFPPLGCHNRNYTLSHLNLAFNLYLQSFSFVQLACSYDWLRYYVLFIFIETYGYIYNRIISIYSNSSTVKKVGSGGVECVTGAVLGHETPALHSSPDSHSWRSDILRNTTNRHFFPQAEFLSSDLSHDELKVKPELCWFDLDPHFRRN